MEKKEIYQFHTIYYSNAIFVTFQMQNVTGVVSHICLSGVQFGVIYREIMSILRHLGHECISNKFLTW